MYFTNTNGYPNVQRIINDRKICKFLTHKLFGVNLRICFDKFHQEGEQTGHYSLSYCTFITVELQCDSYFFMQLNL